MLPPKIANTKERQQKQKILSNPRFMSSGDNTGPPKTDDTVATNKDTNNQSAKTISTEENIGIPTVCN